MMKIENREEYEELCKELEAKSDAIGELMNAEDGLVERRDVLFSKIVLDNKLLQGEWECNPNQRFMDIVFFSKKLKRDEEFRELMSIGPNIEGRRYVVIEVDGVSLRVADDNVRWKLELSTFYGMSLEDVFKFFKDNKMKMIYPHTKIEITNIENRLLFLKRFAEL